jgi:fatty-acyl-CoA synthase
MYEVTLSESYVPAQGGDADRLTTIGEMLRTSAAAAPERPALKELGFDGAVARTWTYGELLHDAERLGRALASRHPEGARVAVYANNVPEWVLLELGCAFAGLTLVTVNPAYQPRELKYVLEQSRSEAIYYVADFRGNPMQQIADSVCDELPAVGHRILLTDHDALFAGEHDGELRDPQPTDPVQIQYTSGTTGFPKGAVLHHQGLVQNGYDAMVRAGCRPGDVFVHHMPLFHTTGCAILVCGGLGVGATMLLAPMFDPDVVVDVVARERARFILGVPTMLVMDERGYLAITGRVKEMIIRGGENLFPAEIENAMLEHDAIAECAVVGIPDDTWGEQVACFMRAVGDERPDDATLKAFIRERLAPQKTPQESGR